MGIYDRDYVRNQQRRGPVGPGGGIGGGAGGFAGPRAWSVNTWLIVINVAVFFIIQPLLGNLAGVPTLMQAVAPGDFEQDVLRTDRLMVSPTEPASSDDRNDLGRPLYRFYADAEGAQAWPAGVNPPPNFVLLGSDGDGNLLVAPYLARDTYIVRDPLDAYGHFSTAKGFIEERLSPGGTELVINLQVWRFISFQFLHAGFWHLFFNMFGLFIFGGMAERYLGSKRYLSYYLLCGIFGAVAYLILNFMGGFLGIQFAGALINDPHTPLVGASAGVFGVIMAAAAIAPNTMIQLLFPPIPIKMKWFAYGYVGIAAFNLLTGGQNAGGDAAHLGGAIAGAFFIRRPHLLKDFFAVLPASKGSGPRKSKRPRRGGPSSSEVDRVLEKVSAKGIHSLTDAEKKVLQRVSEDDMDR